MPHQPELEHSGSFEAAGEAGNDLEPYRGIRNYRFLGFSGEVEARLRSAYRRNSQHVPIQVRKELCRETQGV